MERSSFTLDLGAIRRNAETLLRAAGGAELWAVVKANGYGHGAADVAHAALRGGASALCVATVDEALELRAVPALDDARVIVMGPANDRELRRGELGAARARLLRRTDSRWRPSASEDRHGHGQMGSVRAPRSDEKRRRRHEPSRCCRVGCRLHEPAGRALSRGDRRPRRHARSSSGEQRGNVALSARVVRRGSLRHRAVRHLSLRKRSGVGRSRARAAVGVVRRAREAPRARRQHRLRAALRRGRADLDRSRAGRLRGRLQARHDGHGGPRRR